MYIDAQLRTYVLNDGFILFHACFKKMEDHLKCSISVVFLQCRMMILMSMG